MESCHYAESKQRDQDESVAARAESAIEQFKRLDVEGNDRVEQTLRAQRSGRGGCILIAMGSSSVNQSRWLSAFVDLQSAAQPDTCPDWDISQRDSEAFAAVQ
jgi:hypothetical protein